MTVKVTCSLTRIDECIDTIDEMQYFNTIGAYSGYCKMNTCKQNRHKTEFVFHAGTFQCIRMPFRLTNTPAGFPRALELTLTLFKWKTCFVYLNDVIISSNNVEYHFKHVADILTALRNAGVTLMIDKCYFFQQQVDNLGHMV